MKIFYSGSFAPFHDGHAKVAQDIFSRFGVHPVIEININASDCTGKKSITGDELGKRFASMPMLRKVATPYPLYTQKADYLRDLFQIPTDEILWFACGCDTIEKMDKWACDTNRIPSYALSNLEKFKEANIRFIVYPRFNNKAIKLENESLSHRTLIINNFTPIEISSTQLREKQQCTQ